MSLRGENMSMRMGLRDGLSIGLGYLPVSFAFGLFATGAGLSVWQTLLISLFNITSAGQLAAVPIIASAGSLIELALTQLVINLRYSLMSVSLSQRLGDSMRLGERMAVAFANTDEVFAVAMSRGELLGRRYLFGLIIPPILGWTSGTLLGAASGELLPEMLITSLGIAIYAMFIAIVMPAAKASPRVILLVLLSVAASCAFKYVPVLNKVQSGFVIIICALVIGALFALIFPIGDEDGADGEDPGDATEAAA